MDSTRVLVVSDSHLSARTPEAVANWEAVVAHVAAGEHDLVVHVGDIPPTTPPPPPAVEASPRRQH